MPTVFDADAAWASRCTADELASVLDGIVEFYRGRGWGTERYLETAVLREAARRLREQP
jgi:hypothetical protein